MRNWKKLVSFLMALAMLAGLAVPAAAGYYEAITLNQEKRVTVSYDNSEIFSFTPTEDGYYSFQSDDYNDDPKATVYDSDMNVIASDDDGGVDYNFEITWYAEAGQTYYLEARGTGTYTAQVIMLVTPTSLVLDKTALTTYVDPNYYYYLNYSFLPENAYAESVTFSSSNEAVVDVGEYGEIYVLSPGTAVITATSESGLTASCTVTVREPSNVVCDQVVTADEADEDCRLRFTPTVSGWYAFYSTSIDMDPWGYIQTEDGTWLDYDSYSGEYNNFLCRAWLEAGSSYLLVGQWIDYDNGYTIQFQVTALNAPETITLNEKTLSLYVDQYRYLDYEYAPALSIPETVTWTSSDEKVATVDEYGCVTAHSGGTALITATSESGLSDTCTVTGKVVPVVTCEDVITVTGEDNDSCYKFIPDTTGWYGFYSHSNNGGDPYGWISDRYFSTIDYNNDNGVDENFLVKARLEAGETYYLGPQWSICGPSDEYEAQIAPLAPATGLVISEQTLTKQVGVAHELSVYTVPLLSIPEDVTWTSSNETVATVDSYGDISCLSAGTAQITCTSDSGLQASCSLTVVDVPAITLNQTVTLENAQGLIRHQFTAPQEGWYAFESLNNSRDTYATLYSKNGNYLDSDDDSGEGSNFLLHLYMQSGESCILESRPYSSDATEGTYDIRAFVPPTATGIELGEDWLDGFVGSNSDLNYSTIPEKAVPPTVTWSSSNEAVVRADSDGDLYYLSAGTAVITVTTEQGFTDSCTVVIKEVLDLHAGDQVTLRREDGTQRFRFVPTVTGAYHFYTTGDQGSFWCDIYGDDGSVSMPSDSEDNNLSVYPYLIAGDSYEICIGNYSSGDGEYTVHLEKAVDATGIQLSQTTVSGEPGERFPLTVSLSPENAAPMYINWQSSDTSVATYDSGYVYLQGEGSATITVTTSSGFTASCRVTVAYQAPTPIQCDTPVTVTAAEGTTWFSFVPQTSGWYRFFSTSTDADPWGAICDGDRNELYSSDDYDGHDFSARYELTAGETYYLSVRFYGDDASDSTTVELERMVEATGITLSKTAITGYEGDSYYLGADLTPEHAAPQKLTWTSSDQSVVTVNEYGDLFLKQVGTAEITVTGESGIRATCTVTVTEIPSLTLNQAQALDGSQSYYGYKFTPTTSGWYGFYTTGESDTYGILQDENGKWLTENDDSAEDMNYVIRYELEAGKTYYLRSTYYDELGPCTLYVAKLTKPTGIQLEDEHRTVYVGWDIYASYSFLPIASYSEGVTWSSSNTAVVEIDEYGELVAVAPGSAVLTITSESGLTDTLTVVVAAEPENVDNYGCCGDNLLWQRKDGVVTITGFGDMYNDCWFGNEYNRVVFPEGMTSIGNWCFAGQELQELQIPAAVTDIGYRAFDGSTMPSIRFLGSAPEIDDNAFQDVTTTAYYPAGDPSWTEEVRQSYGGNITWVSYEPGTVAGVTVSGSVDTGATGTTTLELLLNGAVAYSTTVSGKTGTYSLTDVAPGSYTLRVSKLNHETREYTVTVGGGNVTQDVKIHLIGDVTGDGRVNVVDVARIYAHSKKAVTLEGYEFLCADINNDGRANVVDAAKAYAHSKKTASLW